MVYAIVLGSFMWIVVTFAMLRASPPPKRRVLFGLLSIFGFAVLVSEFEIFGTPYSILDLLTHRSPEIDKFGVLRVYGMLVGAVLGLITARVVRTLRNRVHPNPTIERDARKSGARPSF